jgi:hypothetical protein
MLRWALFLTKFGYQIQTMKTLKTLYVSLFLAYAGTSTGWSANPMFTVRLNETPVKTVVIRHPMADDASKFFSASTVVHFEVYKPGTQQEKAAIIAALQKDAVVETVSEGPVVGDYHSITLVLKSVKDKAWFVAAFKKAGLNTIKMNNNPIVNVDKL